ncbi:ABC transporter ATP-binding protein [Haladaptatus sp. CMSO5]|uniref:ABC transporter ATP-binding protein n=1 Tax=Haladaptatus sp. CMSO5 TaxID=3120514 RepID=UPI002FCE03EC
MSTDTDSDAATAAAEGEYILETKGLTKRFGGLTAVDDVDCNIPYGEIRCLIGPNGAGKSTFFKMLAGRLQPSNGHIIYQGDDITDLEPHERARRGVSIKFQDVSVYPNLSVRENLRIPVQRYHDGSSIRSEVEDLVALVRLEGNEDVLVDNLSHGQQQWLEIAMATAIEPQLLLLDEPTAGMTIEETEETGDLIQTLADQGMTVVVVEHDINFVRQIAEVVTVLHNGQVFAEGTVSEIESNEEVQRIYLGQE